MGFIKSLFKWGVIIGILAVGIQIWITKKTYIFDEKVIEEIGKKHAGGENIPEMVTKISSELRVKYPYHVLPLDDDIEMIFMNSGGKMCAGNVLHQSATEAVVIYGTAMDTSGHSGRHWAEATKIVLSGSVKIWKEGTYKSVEYKAGDVIKSAVGEASGVTMSEGTWLLSYGRGFIFSIGPYTLADSLFSTLDFHTIFKILRMSMKATIYECSHCFTHIIDTIKHRLLAAGAP
ncbi:sigma non-opioid intracellular receptor 1-like [Tubulanus polymorphus]|uniref:sigma non-opioid intracellular receptor 1-like n=1 Tax=Tubulanus polymorphus TaxID=672921 RepID=UPI003DA32297